MSLHGFVTCFKGLEEVVADELRSDAIRARNVQPGSAGVTFEGDRGVFYRANLWLRSGIRVLEKIGHKRVNGPDELYEWGLQIDWPAQMALEQTFSVEARVWDSEITHSKYAALRIKDALCDQFRARTKGKRPNVEVHGADLPLFLYLYRNTATLYRDGSGETLHKRGYRDVMHRSSLNEAVAAAMLSLAGWDGKNDLVDPMCGSGTLAIEAALKATRRAPGLFRKEGEFPFERWPDFERGLWQSIRAEAEKLAIARPRCTIAANDLHGGALSLARRDAERAGVAEWIRFDNRDISDYVPPGAQPLVVVNPPWGQRLKADSLEEPWKKLRFFLKDHCAPGTAWVLCGNPEATRFMGLKASRKVSIRIGKVECRVLRYDILPPKPSASKDS